MSTVRMAIIACVFAVCGVRADEIKHRFLLSDESRHLLHYVDQTDPAKNWSKPIGGGIHDLQLIGDNEVLVSQGQGYSTYDLHTQKMVNRLDLPALNGAISARRRLDDTTVIGANQKGITVFDLSPENKITRKMSFPELKTLRMMRLTAEGNVILAEEQGLTEVAFDAAAANGGKIIKRIKLPRNARNAFMGLKRASGNCLVGGGFGHAFRELSPEGAVVRELEAKEMPKPLVNLFYAGFQVLKNGNVVVCNWTGHSAPDSEKGWQLVEFAPDGKVVWHWHDAKLAGTAVMVIVLDELDTLVLCDDVDGVLKAMK